MKPKVSLIIPAKNEAESLPILCQEIAHTFGQIKSTFEVIIIDDGSTDNTWETIKKLHAANNRVIGLRHRGHFGKAVGLTNGFNQAKGDIIFTLDADLQDNPKELPLFFKKFDEGYDLVIGWKKNRHDPVNKLVSSWLFNWVVRILTGTKFHDINCGFKAYKREVITNIDFGELFRFIPVLSAKQNYKVAEIVVDHRARKFGKSKFGMERAIQGGLDLITVVFLTRFAHRPSQLFGSLGLISGFIGLIIGMYITYLRITTGGIDYHYPLLFLGVLLIIMGVQFISTGLLAEMLLQKKLYQTDTLSETAN